MVVARTQHHPVLTESHRLPVLVSGDVLDFQRGHSNPLTYVVALNRCNFCASERTHMDDAPSSLLAADEPQPVTVTNEGGRSPFVIVTDHAGRYLPRCLQMLGLQEAQCEGHIAWDIGAGAVSCLLGDALDTVVIRQNYSRLAIDCNRTPGSETSIVELSEYTTVPGNIGLSQAQIECRV